MLRHSSIALLVAGLALVLSQKEARAEEKAKAEKIARLIGQLGSEQFEERDQATKALDALGPAALKALQEAARDSDAEIRRRAEGLVQAINRRVETARLLEAKRVRLVFKDTPLPDAVQSIARQTGFKIQLEGDRTQLASRKITLDTGETSFWEALDQFCRQASLRERPVDVYAEYNPYVEGKARRIMIIDDARYSSQNQDGRLILMDGKPQTLPTTYQAGALRIRALQPENADTKEAGNKDSRPVKTFVDPNSMNGFSGPGQIVYERADREVAFTLDVASEPKMQWISAVDLRIEKAVDDKGQTLTQSRPYSAETVVNPYVYANMDLGGYLGDYRARNAQHLPVRLAFAPKTAPTVLKELKGVVFAQVRTPPEPLMTVDNILKAAGQTFPGTDGGSLKVIEAKREDSGKVKLLVQIDAPPVDPTLPNGNGIRFLVINRGPISQPLPPALADQLLLLDANGDKVTLMPADSVMESAGNGNGSIQYRLTYQPNKAQGEPVKFVYSARRTVVLEVPFTLKDVPLPK